jgi:hypothetical protein
MIGMKTKRKGKINTPLNILSDNCGQSAALEKPDKELQHGDS